MNLNDPFGRLQSKKQKEYESLRDSLKDIGLNNTEEAQALLEKLKRRGTVGIAIIIPVSLLLALILSKLSAFILACGVLAAFWLIMTTRNSREYVQRYIQEELGDNKE